MMRTKVTSPSGEVFWVNHPDDATDEEILAYAQANMPKAQAAAPEKAPEWSDIGANILPSAGKFAGGIVDMVSSPVQTLKGVADLGAGALRAGVKRISPSVAAYLDRIDNPETTQRLENTATGAGNMLAERYGSLPALKKTIIQDPVGAAADFSTLATGGAMMAPKAGTVANTLRTAAKLTDPLSVPVGLAKVPLPLMPNGAASAVGSGARTLAAETLGLMTGAGGDSIRGAYQAGREGGEAGAAFRQHISGKGDFEQVLKDAQAGLGNIAKERSAAYQAGMEGVRNSGVRIDMAPIVQKANEAVSSVMYNGRSLIDDAEMAAIARAKSAVDDWAADPTMHNPAGLDALKRRLDAVTPDNPMHSQARRVISEIKNSVKASVVDAVPEYRQALDDYSASKGLTDEITRTLSLGPKASADTGLRKLQSIGRNNVNTNYGNRQALIRELQDKGGVQLMPAIHGQNLSSWTPRGIQGVSAVLQGVAGAGGIHPFAPAGLLLQSPRLMGLAAHTMGRGARNVAPVASRINPRLITPMQRLDALGQLELERRKKAQQANASRQNSKMGVGY